MHIYIYIYAILGLNFLLVNASTSATMGRTGGFNVAIYALVIAYLVISIMTWYPLIAEARIPDFATVQGTNFLNQSSTFLY